MRKAIILASGILLLAGTAAAQPKFGHVNSMEILEAMPEAKTVALQLDSFQVKLQAEYDNELKDYQKLVEELDKLQKSNASQTMLNLKQDEVMKKQEYLQKLTAVYQEELAEKEQKLMYPVLQKVENAIKEVSKEKGLNYVFDTSKGVLLYVNESDNIVADVKTKLGIK